MVALTTFDAGARLFGRTRAAVLGLLLLRPDEQFHLRQIVRLAGGGMGAVQRELAALLSGGVVRREQSGRQVYYQADSRSSFFAELQGLVLKTSGLAVVLRGALSAVESRICAAAIFGSVAGGTMHQESDVDLLVVSADLSMRDLAGPIREASSRLGREINTNLYRPAEWAARFRAGHPLVRSILAKPRMTLIGDEHELERMAEERVGQAASARRGGDPKATRSGRARPARRK